MGTSPPEGCRVCAENGAACCSLILDRWLLDSLNAMHLSQSQDEGVTASIPDFASPIDYVEPEQEQEPAPNSHDELPPLHSEKWQATPSSRGLQAPAEDFALDLPPPDSKDWESVDISAPVVPTGKQARKAKNTRRPAF